MHLYTSNGTKNIRVSSRNLSYNKKEKWINKKAESNYYVCMGKFDGVHIYGMVS